MANLDPVPHRTPLVPESQTGLIDQRVWVKWLSAILFRLTYVQVGTGSPAGIVVASRGQVWLRTDGAAGSTLYLKTGNDATFNGWTAVA